ncbi:MAG: aminoglycoside phosphotransferase family protein [Nitrospiraceae bacterium]|nr:aminoglycoside phosphotransferase family protein [Nitrospiraceae bacterium]
MDFSLTAARHFTRGGITGIKPFGSGNINSTFLVESEDRGKFVLQRINTRVFQRPEDVMRNMRVCTEHIKGKNNSTSSRLEVPGVVLTTDGLDYWVDDEGGFWRALTMIEGAQSFNIIQNETHARQAGYALGLFHRLLSDLPPGKLADTLPGFHITPGYLAHYERALAIHKGAVPPEAAWCMDFIAARKELANVLENAKGQGRLPVRVMHGDPKINNILVNPQTFRAISVIDLDTVKPGLVHYDIGDCLRSGCNPIGEETADVDSVYFHTGYCRAILEGYLDAGREFLTSGDFEFIYPCVRLIAFELGLRFFTDYLEGNVYFKANSPGHNLKRALVQFRLTESIEHQEADIRQIVREGA